MKVPLEDVRSSWLSEWYPEHARTVADHYGIYQDLFDSAFFLPEVPLTVEYDYDDEFVTPVYLGNYVKPTEVGSLLLLLLHLQLLSLLLLLLFLLLVFFYCAVSGSKPGFLKCMSKTAIAKFLPVQI